MRSEDGLPGPLRVLFLTDAPSPSESTGPSSVAYEYAKRTADRGWQTTVVSADPTVTAWGAVRQWREPGEWFTRCAVPRTHPATETARAAPTPSDPHSAATRFFIRLLRTFEPELVHVVDDVHLPVNWPELAGEAGVPVLRWAPRTGPRVGSIDDEMAGLVERYREVVRGHGRPGRHQNPRRPLQKLPRAARR